jgi:hypothetical protein
MSLLHGGYTEAMSAPLVPSPLDYLGRRTFAFYPPIRNIEPNEWVLGSRSWSEVQVVNAKSGGRLWIPWQYVGAVSESHDGLLFVDLRKEIEFRAGSLGPRVKRVIEMPVPSARPPKLGLASRSERHTPAPVIGIRVENREDSPMNKALIGFGLAALFLAAVAVLLSVFGRA